MVKGEGSSLTTSSKELSDPLPPIPDGDFEIIPLENNSTRGVKNEANLPNLAKKQLKDCLREYVDLFTWSVAGIPGLDPEFSCHHLTIDLSLKAVTQHRRKQSPQNTEVVELAVKDLLEAHFIYEARYTVKTRFGSAILSLSFDDNK